MHAIRIGFSYGATHEAVILRHVNVDTFVNDPSRLPWPRGAALMLQLCVIGWLLVAHVALAWWHP